MKTIKNKTQEILRVKDTEVDAKLKAGWTLCPKSEWKKNVRGVKKKSDES